MGSVGGSGCVADIADDRGDLVPFLIYPALAGLAGWAVGFFASDGIRNLLWFVVVSALILLALGVFS